MSLRKLHDQIYFENFINEFKYYYENVKENKIFNIAKKNKLIHEIFLEIIHNHYNYKIDIQNSFVKDEILKYKLRIDYISTYKLFIYILQKYYINIKNYFGISPYDFFLYIAINVCFSNHLEINKFENLINPLNKSIFDKDLITCVNEFENLFKKYTQSSTCISTWYKKYKKIRKTKFILSSIYSLNKINYNIPCEITLKIIHLL